MPNNLELEPELEGADWVNELDDFEWDDAMTCVFKDDGEPEIVEPEDADEVVESDEVDEGDEVDDGAPLWQLIHALQEVDSRQPRRPDQPSRRCVARRQPGEAPVFALIRALEDSLAKQDRGRQRPHRARHPRESGRP